MGETVPGIFMQVKTDTFISVAVKQIKDVEERSLLTCAYLCITSGYCAASFLPTSNAVWKRRPNKISAYQILTRQ